ncbi:protein kinase [Acinetobacter sp. BSP-28]|uniref:protein kinase domain-containing protein n=1 Tax=Acinetobacter sp. BSP-28 TaxID=3344661 RepID=UPI00376F475B
MIQSKKLQNLLQFKDVDFSNICLISKTKPKSLTFGRCLYTFEYQQQRYWLKTQSLNSHPSVEAGFLNELVFYQQFLDQPNSSNCMPDFLLPFQMIPHYKKLAALEAEGSAALILSDAELLLGDCVKMSLQQIKQTFLKLLDAVDQLHQSGWIHGDLKREHFVEYENRTCLIDFEQVQKINSVQNLKNLTATPRYMAPELFHGAEKTVQTDIYALGIILYEWLSAQRLSAKNYQEWAYLHCQQLNIELPQHFLLFETYLRGMLAKQKEKRFTDIYTIKQGLLTEIV